MNENITKLINENPDLALLLSEKDHQINSLTQQVDTLKFTLSEKLKGLTPMEFRNQALKIE